MAGALKQNKYINFKYLFKKVLLLQPFMLVLVPRYYVLVAYHSLILII
jgi:hypothetical protein